MPSPDTLFAFFGIAVVLAVTPGPDNIFVLLQSAMRGPRAGLVVVLGLCTGLLVHTAAVALGLATLFAASAVAFTVLKTGGALYLAWLAWQAFRAPAAAVSGPRGTEGASGASGDSAAMYRRGVLMNLTNPKVAVFFLAFLPQFVEPARGGIAAQIVVFGLVFIVATCLVFGAIAWFSGWFGARLLRSARARRALNWFSGAVFAGLAVRLATSQR